MGIHPPPPPPLPGPGPGEGFFFLYFIGPRGRYFLVISGLEISAHPLTQEGVKTVERVQVTDHSPSLASTYYYIVLYPEYAIQNRRNFLLSTLK